LSNDLFASFLDPTMTYSSAWFDDNEPVQTATRLRRLTSPLRSYEKQAGRSDRKATQDLYRHLQDLGAQGGSCWIS